MSSGRVSKVEMLARVYKLKQALFLGNWLKNASQDRRDGAHDALNLILEVLDEYSS